MVRSVAKKVAWVGRTASMVFGLALVLALLFGVASMAFGANGDKFILGSLNNAATAITKLTGTVGGGPALQVSNPSTTTGATALDLQVATGKAPMKVNSSTKVANLNSDQVDGKSAANLSRVAVMNTNNYTPLPTDGSEVTYGQPLSITAPAAGFVRVNGNVSVLNDGCTSFCRFTARVRHINTGAFSTVAMEEALNGFGNAGLDAVFPVSAGVNTFDIRLSRGTSQAQVAGRFGVLTAEYTPYGSTGTSAP